MSSVKKRIRPGKIEVSPDGTAIVVHFTTEITHLDEDGAPGRVERCAPEWRELPVGDAVRGLRAEDVPGLAQEIVANCKYIPDSKTKQVEQLLARLRLPARSGSPADAREDADVLGEVTNRQTPPRAPRLDSTARGAGLGASASTFSPGKRRGAGASRSRDRHGRGARRSSGSPPQRASPRELLPDATLGDLDEYADELYEDKMELKSGGARRVLRLCTDARHLDGVSEHRSLLGVLSRELRESSKKSNDLAVAIMGVFACLAHFSKFHPVLLKHQCGEATVRVVEYESRRAKLLEKELKLSQGQLVARGSAVTTEERTKLEHEEMRHLHVLERQDRLLQLCLLVLWSLAEDYAVQQQLVKQRLCKLLAALLWRRTDELLITALGFLHKLSIFEQNKDVLVDDADAMARLADLVGHESAGVAHAALRLCYNLSFDARAREVFVLKTCLLAKLPGALQAQGCRKAALRLLGSLAADAALRCAVASRYQACPQLALQLALKCKEAVDPESAAMAVDLAADGVCASALVEAESFPKAAARAAQTGDPLLLRVVRRAVSHPGARLKALRVMRSAPCGSRDQGDHAWLHELLRAASRCADAPRPEVLVEAVGVFAALDLGSPEVPWAELCDAGLLGLLERLMAPGRAEDDVVLEAVILTGVLALDPACARALGASRVVALLLERMRTMLLEDSDMVVQVMFTLRCLVPLGEAGEVVLDDFDACQWVMAAAQEASRLPPGDPRRQAVQAGAEELCNLVVSLSTQPDSSAATSPWLGRVKAFRFELHNAEWCAKVNKGLGGGKDRHLSPARDRRVSPARLSPATGSGMSCNRSLSRGQPVWSDAAHLSDREWDENAFEQSNTFADSGRARHRSQEGRRPGDPSRREGKDRRKKSEKRR